MSSQYIYCFVTFLFLFNQSYGQNDDFKNRFEFSGSLSYDYSTDNGPSDSDPYGITNSVSQSLGIFPTIGYFVTNELEVAFEPEYYIQSKTYTGTYLHTSTTDYQPGIALGIYYNVTSLKQIIPFFGLRVEESWKVTDGDPTLYGFDLEWAKQGWTKPQVMFPSAATGVKLMVIKDFGAIIQLKYSKTTHWNTFDEDNRNGANFEMGVGLFLIL